jgi:hypothetical protein
LKALLSGAITAEEFVTLNEKIGGSDADSNATASRSVADAGALDIAYRARHRFERQEPGEGGDHRFARLRRAGHPLQSGAASRSARGSTPPWATTTTR